MLNNISREQDGRLCRVAEICHPRIALITSAKEVMFYPALVCSFVGLCVCLLTQKLRSDFYEIWWEGGSWANLDPIRFWG